MKIKKRKQKNNKMVIKIIKIIVLQICKIRKKIQILKTIQIQNLHKKIFTKKTNENFNEILINKVNLSNFIKQKTLNFSIN